MSNPEIFLFLHLPRVSLPSPALRPGPPTPPFDLLHPPVTPILCRLEKPPSDLTHPHPQHPTTPSTPYLTKNPPNPPNPFRLFTPVYKLVHVTDERALDLFR